MDHTRKRSSSNFYIQVICLNIDNLILMLYSSKSQLGKVNLVM